MLNKFVAECDRKTEHAKRKLHETQEELGEEAARKVNDQSYFPSNRERKMMF
jgi:hypothetical protein